MESNNHAKVKFGLRKCDPDDISSVIGINERTLPENYPLFFYKQILERYHDAFTLAYLENEPDVIIGYIMWRTERGPSAFQLNQVKKGHLVSLAVLPEFRRLGVASALLERSMDVVSSYNVSEFVLEVRVSNAGAVRLYNEAFKYEKIKIISHYYRDGEDAFFMSNNNDSSIDYRFGARDMDELNILNYYEEKKKEYLCYRCPECNSLLLKGLQYSLVGSVNPNDESTVKCSYCAHETPMYAISVGKFDV